MIKRIEQNLRCGNDESSRLEKSGPDIRPPSLDIGITGQHHHGHGRYLQLEHVALLSAQRHRWSDEPDDLMRAALVRLFMPCADVYRQQLTFDASQISSSFLIRSTALLQAPSQSFVKEACSELAEVTWADDEDVRLTLEFCHFPCPSNYCDAPLINGHVFQAETTTARGRKGGGQKSQHTATMTFCLRLLSSISI